MSGPKSSRYSMTSHQRQILQEQLRRAREARILEERIKTEIDLLQHNCQQLSKVVSELEDLITQSEGFAKEGYEGTVNVSLLRLLCKDALIEIKKAENVETNKNIDQIIKTGHTISSLTQKVHIERKKIGKSLEQQENSFKDEKMKIIAMGFELSFANIGDRKALQENVYLKRIIDELDKLEELTVSEEIKKDFEEIKRKADEIKSTDFLENFYSISVIPFIKRCKDYDRLDKQYGEDYRMLCMRYEYLSKELNHEFEYIPLSAQAVPILLEKLANLEAEELKMKEESYICQCIDEAMLEMNYSVIGSRNVTKKNGKRFKNVLYKFDEGTAVNVTYSNDGQITMELGGIGDMDRMPTEAESKSLEEDMRSFCDDYYEIEKKLKAKGIEPSHISHLPPDAQFAQIINVSDFEMIEDVSQFVAKKSKRRQGGATGTTLYKEG